MSALSYIDRLPLLKVEVVAGDAEVFDNVGNDSPRHVTGMVGEGDQSVGTKGVGVMTMTPARANKFTADFAKATLQLAAVVGGVFAHG
jgi:hypothetical protein